MKQSLFAVLTIFLLLCTVQAALAEEGLPEDLELDSDLDGFFDADEEDDGSDPFNPWSTPSYADDGDDDGYADITEEIFGSDPADATSIPTIALTVSPTPVTVVGEEGETYTVTLTLTNDGLVSLLDVSLTHDLTALNDDDGDEITLSFSTATVAEIVAGATETVSLTVDVENGFDADVFIGTLTLTDGLSGQSVLVPLTLDIRPLVCEEGHVGNLDVTINEPDAGEDFEQGETITVEVEVDNEDSNNVVVVVEAVLWNIDENRVIDSYKTPSTRIEDCEEETFILDLDVMGSAISDADSYAIYVVAYEHNREDEQCHTDVVAVELEQLDEFAVVVQERYHPHLVACGADVEFNVEIENQGEDDLTGVFVEVFSPSLGFDVQGPSVRVRDGERAQLVAVATIPEDVAEGAHVVSYTLDYGADTISSDMTVQVICAEERAFVAPVRQEFGPVPIYDTGVASNSAGIPVFYLAGANILLAVLALLLAALAVSRRKA